MSVREIIAMFLSAFLVIAPLSAGSLAAHNPVLDSASDQENGCYADEKPSDCDSRRIDYKIEVFTGWLVAVGGLQVFVGFLVYLVYRRQAGLMEQQADISRRQADIAERAMTIGDEPRFLVIETNLQPLLDRESFQCSTKIKNVGKTDALMRARGAILLDRPPTSADIAPIEEVFARVPPESSMEIVATINLKGGARFGRTLHFVARAVYDDLFGNQHEFGFCLFISRSSGVSIPHGGPTHNYRRIRKPDERI